MSFVSSSADHQPAAASHDSGCSRSKCWAEIEAQRKHIFPNPGRVAADAIAEMKEVEAWVQSLQAR